MRTAPRVRVTITYKLLDSQIICRDRNALAPTRFKGHLRYLLIRAAITKGLPLPLYRDQEGWRYLVSSRALPAAKLLARLNVVGKFIGSPVVATRKVEEILGNELAMWFIANFYRSGIVVRVKAAIDEVSEYNGAVLDDVSRTATGLVWHAYVCKLAVPEVKVVVETLPHPADLLSAPEEAWNGPLSGKPFLLAFADIADSIRDVIKNEDVWKLNPFPFRSLTPMDPRQPIELKVDADYKEIVEAASMVPEAEERRLRRVAELLASDLRSPR